MHLLFPCRVTKANFIKFLFGSKTWHYYIFNGFRDEPYGECTMTLKELFDLANVCIELG